MSVSTAFFLYWLYIYKMYMYIYGSRYTSHGGWWLHFMTKKTLWCSESEKKCWWTVLYSLYIYIHKYINRHLPEAPSVSCCAALNLLSIASAIVVYWVGDEEFLSAWMSWYKWMTKQAGRTQQLLWQFQPSLSSIWPYMTELLISSLTSISD